MKSLADCRLYTFVDTAYLAGRDPALIARQLCDGGSDLIQLRAKNAPLAEVRRLAEAILPVTRGAGVRLVINDHLELARELGAEICHLGQEDFFDAGYRHVSELRQAGSRGGLHRHRTSVCHRHETNRPARDTGIRPVGGGKCDGAVVCHRRHQSLEPRRSAGGGGAADLCGVGDFKRAGCGGGLSGIFAAVGFG